MSALILTLIINTSLISQDWTFQPGKYAFSIYESKEVQIPCSDLDSLINKKKYNSIYILLRDAGIFKTPNCINGNIEKIVSIDKDEISCALAFYQYRLGDKSKLELLLKSFDNNVKIIGDHCTIELFGFMDEWDQTISRLVELSKDSDGIQAELLISALQWRQYLYGKDKLEQYWYSIGKKKNIKQDILNYYLKRSSISD